VSSVVVLVRALAGEGEVPYGDPVASIICSTWRTVSLSVHSLNSRQNAVDTVAYGLGELAMLGSVGARVSPARLYERRAATVPRLVTRCSTSSSTSSYVVKMLCVAQSGR
jgi:hypothetical protein